MEDSSDNIQLKDLLICLGKLNGYAVETGPSASSACIFVSLDFLGNCSCSKLLKQPLQALINQKGSNLCLEYALQN